MGMSYGKTLLGSHGEEPDDRRLGPADDRPQTRSTESAGRYLSVVTATIAFMAASFVGLLWMLDLTGIRPPPAFSNSYCLDSKLAFFRQDPPARPTHLIVGSSVPWRNVAAATIAEQYPDARPLNAGLCGLMVNQSAFATRFFLERFPTITDVLLVLDPFDMSACRSHKTAIFDTADVSAYLSGKDDLQFYFKYFDLFSLIVNAAHAPEPVTRLGDGPLLRERSAGLVYGPPPAIQRECELALATFAKDLNRSGKHLIVATMPLLSDWSDKYDSNSQARKQLARSIRESLDGTSAAFWDGWSNVELPRADYFDAVHLHWRAVPNFTRKLVQATGFGAHSG